jgi:hypothetical protein
MKISKFAIAALFAAGFISASATASFAEDKPELVIDCAEGYFAVYSEDGTSASCELDAEVSLYSEEPRPIDSCWVSEEGINSCARGGMVPMPVSIDEPAIEPIEPTDCMITVDADGNESTACYDAVPYTTSENGEVIAPLDGEVDESLLRDGVDENLMYQSGVAMPAAGSSGNSSNMLAALGVLVAALGALGIGISRQREAK